jgi:hypothetical protein
MLDRDKIVAVLRKRFAGARAEEIAAATNAIVGLDDDWVEIPLNRVVACSEGCYLARAMKDGAHFKVFERRPNHET